MATSLPLPYEAHPAFRSERPALELDAELVRAFDDAYRQAEHGGATVVRARRGELHAALSRVFAGLTERETDSLFRAFVADLTRLCTGLLDADLDHFAAQQTPTAVAPDRRNLLGVLEAQRYFFDHASAGAVTALHDVAREPLLQLRAAAAAGRTTREDLSINHGTVAKRIVHIVDDEYERRGFNDVVSAYARRPMRVTGAALELSVPTAMWWRNQYELSRPPRTLYAHTDEGLANPKSIMYLTDVGAETGPMSVFPACEDKLALTPLQKLVGRVINSVGREQSSPLYEAYERATQPRAFASQAFRRHFAMLPTAMRYNSHFGWDVVPDSALEKTLEAAEIKMLGPAGSCVIFDGARIIHRGGMVKQGDRVALQIIFSQPPSRLVAVADRVLESSKQVFESRRFSDQAAALRRRLGRVVQQYSRHPHDRLVRSIAKLLPETACVDIGASYYPHGPWEVFRASRSTLWIAVEPNPQNTKYLEDWHWPARTHLVPTGLSEHGGEQTLYVTNTDSGSSLLPPVINTDMEHRVFDRNYYFPVTEKRIATKSFDEALAEVPGVEDRALVIKLDTQGTELAILRGAKAALAAERVVGIETEATLLANPVMAGSGRFWEVCQFLEAKGFELLQLKPIEGGPSAPASKLDHRTYLNECDAVFALRRSLLAERPIEHQLAALGFYLSYHLYRETLALFDAIAGIDGVCAAAGVDAGEVRRLLAD
jgi:FkbM family methyltransferase